MAKTKLVPYERDFNKHLQFVEVEMLGVVVLSLTNEMVLKTKLIFYFYIFTIIIFCSWFVDDVKPHYLDVSELQYAVLKSKLIKTLKVTICVHSLNLCL